MQRGASQPFLLHSSPPFSLSITLLLRTTIAFPCAVRMFSTWNAKTRKSLMGLCFLSTYVKINLFLDSNLKSSLLRES